MRGRLILVEGGPGALRAALVVDGRLDAIEIDPPDNATRIGMVVTARVERHAPGLGTIIRLPDGGEVLLDRGGPQSAAGDEILVQITRDARGGKMPGVSRSVSLSGRALVHLPLEAGIRTSRRLGEGQAVLTAMLDGKPGGWIVRSNAARVDKRDIAAEIAALTGEGAGLDRVTPPNAVRRLLTDHGAPAPDRVVVTGRAAHASVTAWCAAFAPSLSPLIERIDESPFDLHDIDSALADLAGARVTLPAGGSLVIERTEALTAIDINGGSETNVLTANLAAAVEIARQLRLRHVGGIVVIDFISMTRPADRERVQAALQDALANDPARTHVLPMSALGLIEMTRERRGPELLLTELIL